MINSLSTRNSTSTGSEIYDDCRHIFHVLGIYRQYLAIAGRISVTCTKNVAYLVWKLISTNCNKRTRLWAKGKFSKQVSFSCSNQKHFHVFITGQMQWNTQMIIEQSNQCSLLSSEYNKEVLVWHRLGLIYFFSMEADGQRLQVCLSYCWVYIGHERERVYDAILEDQML